MEEPGGLPSMGSHRVRHDLSDLAAAAAVTQSRPAIYHPTLYHSLLLYRSSQAFLSMEFSRQEYWSGLPFPSPGDLPDSGIELRSPTLQADLYVKIG